MDFCFRFQEREEKIQKLERELEIQSKITDAAEVL